MTIQSLQTQNNKKLLELGDIWHPILGRNLLI